MRSPRLLTALALVLTTPHFAKGTDPPICPPAQVELSPAMAPCDSGGEGATSCDTRTNINVGGFGGQEGCGISCTTGFYACCSDARLGHPASCTCRQEVPRGGPWTPEIAW